MNRVLVVDDEALIRMGVPMSTSPPRSGRGGRFLLKDSGPEQLGHLVRTLAAGDTVLASKVTRTVVDGFLMGGADEHAVRAVQRLTSGNARC